MGEFTDQMKVFNPRIQIHYQSTSQILLQYIIFMLQSIAFSAVCGYYYFNVETDYEGDNACPTFTSYDAYSDNDLTKYRNQSIRWDTVLLLLFIIYIVDIARSFCIVLGAVTANQIFALSYLTLCCNDFLTMAVFIMLGIFRFEFAGQLCGFDKSFYERTFEEAYSESAFETAVDLLKKNDLYSLQRGDLLFGMFIAIAICGFLTVVVKVTVAAYT